MPLCPINSIYSSDSFSCRVCDNGLKSYGLQSNECLTCYGLWFDGNSNDFRDAQYEAMCKDGRVKSITVFFLAPIFVLMGFFACCCFHPTMNVFQRVKKHCECNDVDSESEDGKDADKNNEEEAGTNTNHQVATDAHMLGGGDGEGDSYGESDDEDDVGGGRGGSRGAAPGPGNRSAQGASRGHAIIAGGFDETDRTEKDLVDAIRFDHNDKDDKGEIELKTNTLSREPRLLHADKQPTRSIH